MTSHNAKGRQLLAEFAGKLKSPMDVAENVVPFSPLCHPQRSFVHSANPGQPAQWGLRSRRAEQIIQRPVRSDRLTRNQKLTSVHAQ